MRAVASELAMFLWMAEPLADEVYLSLDLRYNGAREITGGGAECQAPGLPGRTFEAVVECVEALLMAMAILTPRLLRIEKDQGRNGRTRPRRSTRA